jgi:hypothetical protein
MASIASGSLVDKILDYYPAPAIYLRHFAHLEVCMIEPRIATLVAALLVAGCGPHMTLMVNTRTGERKECRALVNPSGVPINQEIRENCIAEYRAAGFVPATELK